MLEMKHIYKYYNPGTVNEMCLFQDLNLTVEDGEFVAIVGSNGSGRPLFKSDLQSILWIPKYYHQRRKYHRQKEYRRMSKIALCFSKS